MKRINLYIKVYTLALALVATSCTARTKSSMQSFSSLTRWKVIDLTQPFTANIPIWPGDPKFELAPWATYEKDQYFINRISIGEHSGTHWGTPNTFIKDARSAEMFAAHELVVPAVVIDIRKIAAGDVNYRLSVDDIKAWEKKDGKKISSGSVV